MATIIESKTRSYVRNSYFTDETITLDIWYSGSGQPVINGSSEPEKLYFGMSFYSPSQLLDYDMVIPFQEMNFKNADDTLTYDFDWDISAYQKAIRGHLSEFKQSDIYFYAKATLDGNDYIGWQLCNVTIVDLKAPVYIVSPKYVVTDTTSKNLTGNTSTLIRYVSDVNVSFTAAAQKESTLVSYTIKNGSKSVNSTSILNQSSANVSQSMTDVESPTFYVVVEDSRGIRTSNSAQATSFIEYFYPTTHIKIDNISSTGGETRLTAIGIAFNGSFGSVSNSITVQCRYKPEGGSYSSWITMPATISGNNYTATTSISGLNYQIKYTFQSRIVDAITTVNGKEFTTKLMPVFDWGQGDFRFNVPVNIDGNLIVNGSITSSDPGGGEPVNDYETGSWTPRCNACSSPTYALGSYVKVKNMCIINFYYEGTTNKFLQNSYLYFSGLPYTPDSSRSWQSGGGTCSNYMKGSSTEYFTGWSIEGNLIYGRTNSNGTSDRRTINGTSYTFYYDTGSDYLLVGFTGQNLCASGTIMYKIAE